MRVALLGIVHESNTFVEELTTLDSFKKSRLLFGDDIILEYRHAFHELGGMIEIMELNKIEVVPIVYAEATPGGIVTKEAFEYLLNEVFTRIKDEPPFDGFLVVPHGAGVSEEHDDMDGFWLSKLREIVGSQTPIIGTLDPHANVSELMINSTNALVAYKTNPHIDQRNAGREAAMLMVSLLTGKTKPIQVFYSLPIAISIEQQFSDRDPYKYLLELSKEICKKERILSVSILLGFPYADVSEMGSSLIVISDGDNEAGESAIALFKNYMLSNKELFNGIKKDTLELIKNINKYEKPVLLLDMGDNVGGGAPGNSIFLLDQLEDVGIKNSFICIYDPRSVNILKDIILGDSIQLQFGKRPDNLEVKKRNVTLIWMGCGKFDELTPRHGGQIHFDMGDIAIIKTENGDTVMLTTLRTPPYSLQQLTAFGINPSLFTAIIAKGVNAPIAAYSSVCNKFLQMNTPGVTQADMTRFSFKKRKIPLFPFETY